MSTIREQGLAVPDADLWVVSLDLAAQNAAVREALWPNNVGWDAVIFDEAHRLTPTAKTYHRVGRELSESVPHALFLTATPHRGDEWYFRELLHLVDPGLFPTTKRPDARKRTPAAARLRPGPLHFLRRMKEQLVDYDSRSRLFKDREAHNVKVSLNSVEQNAYDDAQELVRLYFPPDGRILAAMVYGKRAASSLQALAETLRRRRDRMGTDDRVSRDAVQRHHRMRTRRRDHRSRPRRPIDIQFSSWPPPYNGGAAHLPPGRPRHESPLPRRHRPARRVQPVRPRANARQREIDPQYSAGRCSAGVLARQPPNRWGPNIWCCH